MLIISATVTYCQDVVNFSILMHGLCEHCPLDAWLVWILPSWCMACVNLALLMHGLCEPYPLDAWLVWTLPSWCMVCVNFTLLIHGVVNFASLTAYNLASDPLIYLIFLSNSLRTTLFILFSDFLVSNVRW